jgi:ABC-type lipoprotein release transport system permease subunit
VGLINSVLSTIAENTPFLRLMRILGFTEGKVHFMVLYMTVLQGCIGGLLGCLAAYLFQGQIQNIFNLLGFATAPILSGFEVDLGACGVVLAFCVIMTLVAGIISLPRAKHLAEIGRQ